MNCDYYHKCNNYKCRYLYQFTKYLCVNSTVNFLEMFLNIIALSPIETYQAVIIIFNSFISFGPHYTVDWHTWYGHEMATTAMFGS